MEVLETKEEAEKKAEQKRQEEEVVKEISKTLHEAQDRVDARHADDENAESESKKLVANVDEYVEGKESLKTVKERIDPVNATQADPKAGSRSIEVTDAEKEVFFKCVLSGDRYRETVSLFNGNLNVTFRSRSSLESEAVDAFLRRRVANGLIETQSSYSDGLRCCLLAACVEEVNGEKFPTLTEAGGGESDGMFYHETKEGLDSPKWLWLYDKWRDKPELISAAIIDSFFDFEAKYWLMISNSKNSNFWIPGEPSGNSKK